MMYPNATLVTLANSGNYISIQTTTRRWKRSYRFFLNKEKLLNAMIYDREEVDFDIGSFVRMRTDGDNVVLIIYWMSAQIGDTVSGHVETVEIPKKTVYRAIDADMDDSPIRIVNLDPDNRVHAKMALSPDAHAKVAKMDKRMRRALSKALARNFFWGEETVSIYADWNNSFYFAGQGISGGFVLHTGKATGKDGTVRPALRYEIHT